MCLSKIRRLADCGSFSNSYVLPPVSVSNVSSRITDDTQREERSTSLASCILWEGMRARQYAWPRVGQYLKHLLSRTVSSFCVISSWEFTNMVYRGAMSSSVLKGLILFSLSER